MCCRRLARHQVYSTCRGVTATVDAAGRTKATRVKRTAWVLSKPDPTRCARRAQEAVGRRFAGPRPTIQPATRRSASRGERKWTLAWVPYLRLSRAPRAVPARDDGLAYRRRLLPPLTLGLRRGQAPTPDQVRGRLLSPLVAYVDPSAERGEREKGRGADVWSMLLAMLLSDVAHGFERCCRLSRARWRRRGGALRLPWLHLSPHPPRHGIVRLASGHGAGAVCRVSVSACEPGVAVRSAWLGRPPGRRSAVVGPGSRRVGRWSPSST